MPKLQLGGRYDLYQIASQTGEAKFGVGRSVDFNTFSGSLGVTVPVTSLLTVSGSFARAFRAPTVEELFSNGFHAAAGTFDIGNPDLRAEVNQGGDMVATILRSIDPALPVTTVRATRGKFLRAEPVAALYEQGRVVHAGTFPALEDQMCDFGPDGLSGGGSPDRLDALVWALTSLVLSGQGEPRVRGM